MRMYCITIYNDHYEKIKQLGYIPVGLGKDINSQKICIRQYRNQHI